MQVKCSCGKMLKVPDTMAGKQARCPGCNNVFTVPPAKAPAAAAADDKIIVTCACGKRLAAPATAAGKQVRCPGCGAAVPVSDGTDGGNDAFELDDMHPPPEEQPAIDDYSIAAAHCPNCQAELETGAQFCVDCGTHLTTGVRPPGISHFPAESRPRTSQHVNRRTYGGIGRLGYFFGTLGILALFILLCLATAKLQSSGMRLAGIIVLFILYLVLTVKRLHNLGMSGIWCFIPVVNLLVGFRCLAFQEGYHDVKKLDKAGKIIVVVLVALFVLPLLAGLLLPALAHARRQAQREASSEGQPTASTDKVLTPSNASTASRSTVHATVLENRNEAMAWLRTNQQSDNPGSDLAIRFAKHIDSLIEQGAFGQFLLGKGLLRSNSPHLFCWFTGNLFVAQITEAQAKKYGMYEDMACTQYPAIKSFARRATTLIRLGPAQFNRGNRIRADEKITGTVSYEFVGRPPGICQLYLAYWVGTWCISSYGPPWVPRTARGTVDFSFVCLDQNKEKADKRIRGSTIMVFLGVVSEAGSLDKDNVISNLQGILLEVEPATPTPGTPAPKPQPKPSSPLRTERKSGTLGHAPKKIGDEGYLELVVYQPSRTKDKLALASARQSIKAFKAMQGRLPKKLMDAYKEYPFESAPPGTEYVYNAADGKVGLRRLRDKPAPKSNDPELD